MDNLRFEDMSLFYMEFDIQWNRILLIHDPKVCLYVCAFECCWISKSCVESKAKQGSI